MRRISSVASAKRLRRRIDHFGDRVADLVRRLAASGPRHSPASWPTRFSNECITRSRSSDFLTRPTARSSSDDCRSSVCSKLLCAEPSRSDALDSSLLCSSNRLAIDATSRKAADDNSVSRSVLASIRRAELAKVCAAFSVVAAKLLRAAAQALVDGRAGSPLPARSARPSCELDVDRRPIRSSTLSARVERAPSTADKVSAVRLASALTSAAFSLRSLSVARCVASSRLFCSSPPLWAKRSTSGLAVSSRIFDISAERLREHGVEFAGVGADRLGSVVGALADMLADRGESLRDHVGARDELRLGLRDLLVEFLADRLGGVGEALFDFADLLRDPSGSRARPAGSIRRCKGLCVRLCALGKLGSAVPASMSRALLKSRRVCRRAASSRLSRDAVRQARLSRVGNVGRCARRRAPRRSPARAATLAIDECTTCGEIDARASRSIRRFADTAIRRWSASSKMRPISWCARRQGFASLSARCDVIESAWSAASKMRPRSEARAASASADSPMRTVSRSSAPSNLRRMSPARAASDWAVSTARATSLWSAVSNVPTISLARAASMARPFPGREPASAFDVVIGGAAMSAPRDFGTRGKAASASSKARAISSALASRAAEVCSARSAILRSASLKALPACSCRALSDFHDLFAQRAGDEDGALFEHAADVVDACRQRALHGPGAFLDDAGLPAERLLDLFDIHGEHARRSRGGDLRCARTWPCTTGRRSPRVSAQLVQVVFQRPREHVAAFGELADMAGYRLVDRRSGSRRASSGRLPARG